MWARSLKYLRSLQYYPTGGKCYRRGKSQRRDSSLRKLSFKQLSFSDFTKTELPCEHILRVLPRVVERALVKRGAFISLTVYPLLTFNVRTRFLKITIENTH